MPVRLPSPLVVVLPSVVVLQACAVDGPTAPERETRHGLPLGTLDEVGIDHAALAVLEADAERYHTDALIIVKDGLLVYEENFGGISRPGPAMSASKSFVNLAVGVLISEGRLALGQHVADFVPGWTSDPLKAQITIEHLLSHTSGLDAGRAFDLETYQPIALEPWLVQTPQDSPPGAIWRYNNGAVDALAMIAERAAGESLEDYLGSRMFEPIGATGGEWMRFTDGAPMGAGELIIDPISMTKVGRLLANDGVDDAGVQRIPTGWLEASMTSTPHEPTCGRLWWKNVEARSYGLTRAIADYWATHGISESTIAAIDPIVGAAYPSYEAAMAGLRAVLTAPQLQELQTLFTTSPHFPLVATLSVGPMKCYYANGFLGQYLFVYPERDLVVVRMHYPTDADYGRMPPATEFRELPREAIALVGETLDR